MFYSEVGTKMLETLRGGKGENNDFLFAVNFATIIKIHSRRKSTQVSQLCLNCIENQIIMSRSERKNGKSKITWDRKLFKGGKGCHSICTINPVLSLFWMKETPETKPFFTKINTRANCPSVRAAPPYYLWMILWAECARACRFIWEFPGAHLPLPMEIMCLSSSLGATRWYVARGELLEYNRNNKTE